MRWLSGKDYVIVVKQRERDTFNNPAKAVAIDIL